MNRIMAFAQEAQEVYNNEAVFQHHSSHGWPDAFCVTICRRRRIRVHSVDRVSYGWREFTIIISSMSRRGHSCTGPKWKIADQQKLNLKREIIKKMVILNEWSLM